MKIDSRTGLDSLALALVAARTAGGRPGEVSNRDDEEAVAVVGQTGESVVPGGEGSEETEETTSHLHGLVDGTGRVTLDVGNTEQEEGQVQEEEQTEEGDG